MKETFTQHYLLNFVSAIVVCLMLPGIHVSGVWGVLVVALIIPPFSYYYKAQMKFFTIPITHTSFCIYIFIWFTFLIMFTQEFFMSLHVDNWFWASGFGLILTLINLWWFRKWGLEYR